MKRVLLAHNFTVFNDLAEFFELRGEPDWYDRAGQVVNFIGQKFSYGRITTDEDLLSSAKELVEEFDLDKQGLTVDNLVKILTWRKT